MVGFWISVAVASFLLMVLMVATNQSLAGSGNIPYSGLIIALAGIGVILGTAMAIREANGGQRRTSKPRTHKARNRIRTPRRR